MHEIKRVLKKYGLNDNEIQVYLHLLERVESSAYKISQELNIPRSTIYYILESLKEKKLVVSSRINNVTYYTPESFNVFLREIDDLRESLHSIIPQLKEVSRRASIRKPKVSFYTGKEHMKRIWQEMIQNYKDHKTKEVFATSHNKLFAIFPQFFKKWVRERKKLGIQAHIVRPESERRNSQTEKYGIEQKSIRFIDDQYLSNSEITTFGDKTAIFLFDEKKPQSIVIESKEMTDIFNRLLKFIWDHAHE